MNKYKLQFFTALVVVLLLYPSLVGGVQSGVEKDYYGKVIGQILDPETGEPVKEPFSIYIYESNNETFPNNIYRYWDETDDRGKFQLDMLPFTYYLQFNPKSPTSRYCLTQYPYNLTEKERDAIKVETGKITYFRKKAILGGIIKIYLADNNNVRFNPQEKFQQKLKISSNILGALNYGPIGGKDDLNDGVQTVYKLCEGTYRLEIEFDGLGFRNFKKDNLLVERGKATEVTVNLDLTDITGIEGFVTDAAGIPVEDSDVGFGVVDHSTDDTIGYNAYTNKDGYYKLTGMPAGKYYLTYGYETKSGHSIGSIYGYVEIKKNVLQRLDLQFKKTMVGMEGHVK